MLQQSRDYYIVTVDGLDGCGKQQPVSEPVLTPTGWKPIGDLQVNDYVIGSQGTPIKVTAIYPQVDRRIYTVHFKDGTQVRCGADHLWTVYTQRQRSRNKEKSANNFYVKTTLELQSNLSKRLANNYAYMYTLPMYQPYANGVTFKHAYALGYILGNGCFNNNMLCVSCHTGVVKKVQSLLTSLGTATKTRQTSTNGSQFTYSWGSLDPEIQKYRNTGLSHNKNILDDWMLWDLQSRKDLLAGLLDSDGSVTNRKLYVSNSLSFSSTNKNLICLVQDLTRNIGGLAYNIGTADARTHYKSGVYYNIMLAFNYNPCKLKTYAPNKRSTCPVIVDIKQEDYEEDSVCISVEAEDNLYVTAGYKLTHNSSSIAETRGQLEALGYPVRVYKDFWEITNQPELSLVHQIRSLVLDSNTKITTDQITLLLTTTRLNLIKQIEQDLEYMPQLLTKGLPLIILLDRYVYSTYAYQSLDGDQHLIKICCSYILSLLQPDICVLMNTPIKTCIERLELKARDNFELKHSVEDYTQIVKNYKEIFEYNIKRNQNEPVANVYIIDTEGQNITQVGGEVTFKITNYLEKSKYRAQYVNMELP
jgi:thymidylate kinase